MSAVPIVLHLVDDTTAGGVMRVVDFIQTSPGMAELGEHRIQHIKRGKIEGRPLCADVVVSHLAVSWRSLPALIAMRAMNVGKLFVHIEHSYTEAFVALNVKNRRRFGALLKVSFSLFDRIIAVSHAQAKWLETRGYCRSEKLTTIQSCVDLAPFRKLPSVAGPVRVFGAIGRLDHQKGFDTLITAFRACNNAEIRLHIFGEGDQEQTLRKLAGGDDRIVFQGFMQDPVAAFAQVDAVIMPSRWEAYGLVAIEALSAGRQLICADLDGLNDHEVGGAFLVRAGSISDLTKTIDGLSSGPKNDVLISRYRSSEVLERRFITGWERILRLRSTGIR
jgi:glycosyltransferase involved in cell wall biosynthesis